MIGLSGLQVIAFGDFGCLEALEIRRGGTGKTSEKENEIFING